MTRSHDAFVSYATEDNDVATEIAYGLRANGFSVWFAPLSLRPGDSLLGSIEAGLREARAGVLLVSENYLSKHWTAFEMDVLVRQRIESNKKLVPIWLGVAKEAVEARSLALAGVVAITNTDPIHRVISQLVEALSEGARSRGVIPSWEDPAHRFLQGLGEVKLQTSDGLTTTIFELLVHGNDDSFPFWLAGQSYSKGDLLYRVAEIMAYDPGRLRGWLRAEDKEKLRQMCVAEGYDPAYFG